MIRVTIESWDEKGEIGEVIAVGEIKNTHEGSKSSGIYDYQLMSKSRRFRHGRIAKYERLRLNVWYLVYSVLRDGIWAKQGLLRNV